MGLHPKVFAEVLQLAHADAAKTTAHDSPAASGTIFWLSALRYLRDALAPRGWDVLNDGTYCLTVSPDHQRAILVWSGTDATGIATAIPSNRNAKGQRTIQSVEGNQLMLGDYDSGFPHELEPVPTPYETWAFLYVMDRQRQEIRAELSLPIGLGLHGRHPAWRTRLLLEPSSLRPEISRDVPVQPTVEVAIRRRG